MIRVVFIGHTHVGISSNNFRPAPREVVYTAVDEADANEFVQAQTYGNTYVFEHYVRSTQQ